jgi:hypothetical protein
MTDRKYAEVLVREGIQQRTATAVAPATYPMGVRTDDQIVDLLPRIKAMQTELLAGDVEAAIRIGHFVGGRSARLGERRVASLVRQAVMMSRFYVTEQAADLVSQAEREVTARR